MFYLTLFNGVSAVGWLLLLLLSGALVLRDYVGLPLAFGLFEPFFSVGMLFRAALIVQSLAFLEVLHSLFRLVKTPVFNTVLQVASRLGIFYLFALPFNFAAVRATLIDSASC